MYLQHNKQYVREFTGLTDSEFFRHIYVDHKDERYLEPGYGAVGFIECNGDAEYTDMGNFFYSNPHVLFVDSDGFDYRNSLADIEQNCGTDLDNECDCEERSDELVCKITDGESSCMICGEQYDVFPTFDVFMQHAGGCLGGHN